jgi:hypothetical protein
LKRNPNKKKKTNQKYCNYGKLTLSVGVNEFSWNVVRLESLEKTLDLPASPEWIRLYLASHVWIQIFLAKINGFDLVFFFRGDDLRIQKCNVIVCDLEIAKTP